MTLVRGALFEDRRRAGRGDAERVDLARGEAAPHDGRAVVDAEQPAAPPLHAKGKKVGAVKQLEPRLDLHLRRQQVELGLDGLLDALHLLVVEPEDEAVRRAVRPDRGRGLTGRDAPEAAPNLQRPGGRSRRRRLRTEQRGEGRQGPETPGRARHHRRRPRLPKRAGQRGAGEVDGASLRLGRRARSAAAARVERLDGQLVVRLLVPARRDHDVRTDAHDGGDGLGDNTRILIPEPDDLLLDVAPLRLDLRVLLRHLGVRQLDRAVGRLLLRLVDALGDVGVPSRAADQRVDPALLVFDEPLARADAQELALPHADEPVGVEDALEDVTNGRAIEVQRDGARDVVSDDHVDFVVLGKQPQGALGAGVPQRQVDGVCGQALVAVEAPAAGRRRARLARTRFRSRATAAPRWRQR